MNDEFNKDSLIVLVLNTLASAINYLCQIAMGHTMSLESFGIINTIFSFVLVFGFPGTTFYLLATKHIAEDPRNNKVVAVVSAMLRYVLIVSAVFFVISLIAYRLIALVLGSDNLAVILLTVLVICVGFVQPIYSGALSGMKKFVAVGLLGLVMPLFKSVGVVVTAFLQNEDYKLLLVLLLMVAGFAVAGIAGRFLLNRYGVKFNRDTTSAALNFGNAGLLVMACNFLYIIFSNFDLLAINTIFGTTESGLYSSAMLFGRIIFYFVTALVMVMLPFVASEKARHGAPEYFLKRTILYTIGITILFFLPLYIAPRFFLGFIYGERYLDAAKFIPYVSIFSILISLLNIAITYLIGIGRLKTLTISMVAGLLTCLVIIYNWHTSFEQVLLLISAVLAVLVFINMGSCFRSDVKRAERAA